MLTYNYIDIPRPYWTSTSTPEEIYADILEFASALNTMCFKQETRIAAQ